MTYAQVGDLLFVMALASIITGYWPVGVLWITLCAIARLCQWRAERRAWRAWLDHVDEECRRNAERNGQ